MNKLGWTIEIIGLLLTVLSIIDYAKITSRFHDKVIFIQLAVGVGIMTAGVYLI